MDDKGYRLDPQEACRVERSLNGGGTGNCNACSSMNFIGRSNSSQQCETSNRSINAQRISCKAS
ncbi:hypothetical protein K438DRAFT_1835385 [Mycena galopus ATCC 62051]|nr:hypothetical protein K438DRAFT_1835385 [Mycena galopus ATCC 62051]